MSCSRSCAELSELLVMQVAFELVAIGAVLVSEKPLTAVLSGGVETIYSYLSVAQTMTLLNCRHFLLKSVGALTPPLT